MAVTRPFDGPLPLPLSADWACEPSRFATTSTGAVGSAASGGTEGGDGEGTDGGGEGGGGATASGTTTSDCVLTAGSADATATPRAEEMAAGGEVTRALAAAWTAATVVEGVAEEVVGPMAAACGMVRMVSTLMLAARRRMARKQAGSLQLSEVCNDAFRSAC